MKARLQRESLVTWAAWACFAAGAVLGAVALWGEPRPIVGDGSFAVPAAGVAALVTASAFVTSTLMHRRDETHDMPAWQRAVSHVSSVAVALAFAALAAVAVLASSEVLQVGLQGLTVPTFAGAGITGGASAAAGSLAFAAGIELRTRDLANLLFAFLGVGTLLAMLTADDPTWWQRAFSQLGTGTGDAALAFNGTLVVAGLLVATIGSYVGRDLHRLLGDARLGSIAWVVVAFVATGVALTVVGLAPLDRATLVHDVAAVATLVLLVATAVVTTLVLRDAPRSLHLTTIGLGVGLALAVLLWMLGAVSLAGLEAIAVGLEVVWLTAIVRTLAALTPNGSRASGRVHLVFSAR